MFLNTFEVLQGTQRCLLGKFSKTECVSYYCCQTCSVINNNNIKYAKICSFNSQSIYCAMYIERLSIAHRSEIITSINRMPKVTDTKILFSSISDTPPVYRKMWALWNPKSGIKHYIALYRGALYHLLWSTETMLFFEKIKGVHRNMILRHFCKIRFSIFWAFSCECGFRVLKKS